MKVRCVCGDWHELSFAALALVVSAFQGGDMQTIGQNGISSLCLSNAFTDERIARFIKRYPGKQIMFRKEAKEG